MLFTRDYFIEVEYQIAQHRVHGVFGGRQFFIAGVFADFQQRLGGLGFGGVSFAQLLDALLQDGRLGLAGMPGGGEAEGEASGEAKGVNEEASETAGAATAVAQ